MTRKEELDYIAGQLTPVVFELLKQYGIGVGEMELAVTLDGVSSLPALMRIGGVDKIVEVPLSLIGANAEEAKKEFERMVQEMQAATDGCKTATDNCTAATEELQGLHERIIDAIEQSLQAIEQAVQVTQEADAAEAERKSAEEARAAWFSERQTEWPSFYVQAVQDWSVFLEQASSDELARREAEQERTMAEQDRASAESSRSDAESLRSSAEQARAAAEKDRSDAELARAASELARAEAETQRTAAEQERVAAELERKQEEELHTRWFELHEGQWTEFSGNAVSAWNAFNEAARAAESDRATAEASRASAEESREAAESSRKEAETLRSSAESSRKEAEASRAASETERSASEGQRKEAETRREADELSRTEAEDARKASEEGRYEAEALRAARENGRISAETDRRAAEAERRTAFEVMKGECESATEGALSAAEKASNLPVIRDGMWWVYDAQAGGYVNTGQSASSDFRLTKEAVESVLTGEVASHSHPAYFPQVYPEGTDLTSLSSYTDAYGEHAYTAGNDIYVEDPSEPTGYAGYSMAPAAGGSVWVRIPQAAEGFAFLLVRTTNN